MLHWYMGTLLFLCRSREKAQSSSNAYPSLYEVPMSTNPCYAAPDLSTDGHIGPHTSATNADNLSEEWEGSADYEYVT